MLAALWAYDGWNNMPMAAGEVQDPGRNIPRALIVGMIAVMAIYCLANLSYFYALPIAEIVTSNSTEPPRGRCPSPRKAAPDLLGEYGGKLVAVAFVISAFGALNGSILSNARVPYAMARDGLFFAKMGTLSAGTRVPVWSLVVQTIWSSVLAVSGTYDQLTDCLLFASWIFYGLVTSSVFVLRREDAGGGPPLSHPGIPADAAPLRAGVGVADHQHLDREARGVGHGARAHPDRTAPLLPFSGRADGKQTGS